MNDELQLRLQAYLDGELPEGQRAEVAALLEQDTAASALFAELTWTRHAVVGSERALKVPETREFYWSQIEREISRQAALEEPVAPAAVPFWRWLQRILVPVSGLALVLMVSVMLLRSAAPGTYPYEVEMASNEMGALTFRDQAERMTVVWLYNREDHRATLPPSEPSHDD